MQVLLVFLQLGGDKAPFISKCANVAGILWKFRSLSFSLLQNAWSDEDDFESLGFAHGTSYIGVAVCPLVGHSLLWLALGRSL